MNLGSGCDGDVDESRVVVATSAQGDCSSAMNCAEDIEVAWAVGCSVRSSTSSALTGGWICSEGDGRGRAGRTDEGDDDGVGSKESNDFREEWVGDGDGDGDAGGDLTAI